MNDLLAAISILLREGLEALLVFGALLTFLKKSGHGEKTKYLYIGGFFGIIASIIAAFIIAKIYNSNIASQELLEGITTLVAAIMLYNVSCWFISKTNVAKLHQFIQDKTTIYIEKNSLYSLSIIAFLTIFREGFETVLFYTALIPQIGWTKVSLSIVIGLVLLIISALAIFKFGVKVPTKPFFAVTGLLLYYLAFKFTGTGIREMQEVKVISETAVSWLPTIDSLGIYPTVETAFAQGLLLITTAWKLLGMYQRSKVNKYRESKLY